MPASNAPVSLYAAAAGNVNRPSRNSSDVQQWSLTVGASNIRASPDTPRRNLLVIVNTGPNACEFRFNDECSGDANSYPVQSGDTLRFPDVCPKNALNFRCADDGGTTVVIIEGKEPS